MPGKWVNRLLLAPASAWFLIMLALLLGVIVVFSFDDFIIAIFVAGSERTLPIYVFFSNQRSVTPEVNAIGTMALAVSLGLLDAAQFLLPARGTKSRTAEG